MMLYYSLNLYVKESVMNIREKKLEIVQLVLNTNKATLLNKIEEILKKNAAKDWWDEISDEEKKAIEQGLAEADRGEFISHEEVMKQVKDKYNLDG